MAEVITLNQDIAGIHRRCNRFIKEELGANSARTTDYSSFDQIRLQEYVDALRTYQGFVVAQPELDLVETEDTINLGEDPVIPEIENESTIDVIRLLENIRNELVRSNSSNIPSGISVKDNARLAGNISKLERFLQDYIATTVPIDLPASSPKIVPA